jgi:hypothetical protein
VLFRPSHVCSASAMRRCLVRNMCTKAEMSSSAQRIRPALAAFFGYLYYGALRCRYG